MKIQVLNKPSLENLNKTMSYFLSIMEIQNYSELHETRQHDFLSGRYLLKKHFVSMVDDDTKMTDVSISYDNKKPQIIHRGETYRCSISHSRNYVACIINRSSHTGIDIEEFKPRTAELQDYILSKQESTYFQGEDKSLATRAWSIKEAVFKADTHQIPLNEYLIVGRSEGSFFVENSKTKWSTKVTNQTIDNYTVSYTIPDIV